MEDMDFDLLESDDIRDFLNNKLLEIKQPNDNLTKALIHREQIVSKLTLNRNTIQNLVVINKPWKNVLHGKFVIGFSITNNSNKTLHHVNVLLDWDASDPLRYKFILISPANTAETDLLCEGFHQTHSCYKIGVLLIVMDVPQFFNQLVHTLSGLITFKDKDERVNFNVPNFELSSEDVTSLAVNKLTGAGLQSILVYAACSQLFELVLLLPPNWNRSLETVLETYCCLKRIHVETKTAIYYVAQKITPDFDGSLIEVMSRKETNKATDFNVYVRDFASVVKLVHYLHKQIVNVRIVPKHIYRSSSTNTHPTGNFKSFLNDELQSIQQFLESNRCDFDKLVNAEYNTDMGYQRCQENKEDSSLT